MAKKERRRRAPRMRIEGVRPYELGGYRAVVLRLRPTREQELFLVSFANKARQLYNEINAARRRAWEEGRLDLRDRSVYRELLDVYKGILGYNAAEAVLRRNDEAWRSFLSLLRLAKKGELPEHMRGRRLRPPGYWGEPRIVLRGDPGHSQVSLIGEPPRPEAVEIRVGPRGGFRLRIPVKGEMQYVGRPGRVEIWRERGAWWISFAFREPLRRRSGDAWRSVPLRPLGNLRAGVDLGINNLLAVYVEDGSSLLVTGRPIKAISYRYQRLIAEAQRRTAAAVNNGKNMRGVRPRYKTRMVRALHDRWRRKVRDYVNWAVRRAVEWMYRRGVSTVYVGYPEGIAQREGSFLNTNVWSYAYVIKRLAHAAWEHGMTVYLVDESHTSSQCPIHGDGCGRRVERGLFICERLGKAFNADLVGALNILLRGAGLPPVEKQARGIIPSPRMGGDRDKGPDAGPRDAKPASPGAGGVRSKSTSPSPGEGDAARPATSRGAPEPRGEPVPLKNLGIRGIIYALSTPDTVKPHGGPTIPLTAATK